jgi:uncharacterized membrane protein (UPF0127 family)
VRAPVVIAIIAAAAAIVIGTVLVFTPLYRVGGPLEPAGQEGGLPGYNQTVVSIADVRLLADIADTPEKRSLGLGVRDSMAEGEGMLFLLETSSRQPFWMNGMKFPIDIIWINSDKEVVHIEHSLEPCPSPVDCPNYAPDEEALYVLETVAGFSERHNVTDGTRVEFDLA